jgi:hypothetical protein
MIVIGLGSGRTGTASLAMLLSSQPNSICFHEMNPSGMRYRGTVQPEINMVEEFQAILEGGPKDRLAIDFSRRVAAEAFDRLQRMDRVELIGDVASYHLAYVDDMIALGYPVRFLCIYRDRTAVIKSFAQKTSIFRWRSKAVADRVGSLVMRGPYYRATNHWMEHDGTVWQPDPVWDKLFPKFEAESREAAIGKYWDYYYEEANRLAAAHGDVFRIFDVHQINQPDGQRAILEFCGVAPERQVLIDSHIHRSSA